MANFDEELLLLLEQHNNDIAAAGESVVDNLLRAGGRGASRDILMHVLAAGIYQIRRNHRRAVREYIKTSELAAISDMGSKRPSNLYQRAQKAIQKRTEDLLVSWMIGEVPLGDMNREGLLREARRETATGDGHLVNARFYSQLAEPMNDTQQVKDYWKGRGVQILRESILNELLAASDAQARRPRRSSKDDRPAA